jgi:tetratricopeptide (TPR) repeat protein
MARHRLGCSLPEPRPGTRSSWADALAPALIALATFIIFSGALRGGFLDWDDDIYLLANQHYRGLGWENLRWMFTTMLGGLYQPLCWLSFAFDHRLWGMDPFGYHLTNVLLHCANAVLFYGVALRLLPPAAAPRPGVGPGRPRLAAAVAALLFALHPLRVESVAWITERKDVLSGFFYLLTVYAYLRRHADQGPSARTWKAVSWAAFALALLAKGMVVTLPAALVILDIYPLRRLPGRVKAWFSREHRGVWLEKLPFLVPALLIALAGYAGLQRAGTVIVESAAAHGARAVFGLAFYLWKTLWPVHLCQYLSSGPIEPFAWPYLLSGAAVGLITLGVILSHRRWPALSAAWAYYAVTLTPVLGLVSFGVQSVADRYSYLSCLPWPLLAAAGLSLAWRRADVWGRRLLCLATTAVLTGLSGLTWGQVGVWRDSETFWKHTIALRPGTSLAHHKLGKALAGQGRTEEAIAQYREALRLKPDAATAHYDWAQALAGRGRTEEAVAQYREALRLKPEAEIHHALGLTLAGQGRTGEAAAQYREALRLKPDYADVHFALANALLGQGRAGEALTHYRETLRLKPGHAPARNNLGLALAGQDRIEEAVAQYREALRLAPDAEVHLNLGNALARQGRTDEAIREYQTALTMSPGFELARKNLDILRRKGGRP